MPTVLVVDDNPEICQMLVTFLGLAGYDVLTACDGRDALHQLARAITQPAVILLDLMMPIMDGIEFQSHHRRDARFRDIPIVCLSARHDAGQTAARLGLSEFLAKPFELDAVVAAVSRHCAA
jgi:two-component system, chemotaxis family, chemotaxis protein CheY